jgi:prevent-host-death family protein
MATYNIYEARTAFSRLVDEAANGEEVVIAKAGEPMVRMVPVAAKRDGKRRRFGDNFLGIASIAPDFYDDLPAGMFEVLGNEPDA